MRKVVMRLIISALAIAIVTCGVASGKSADTIKVASDLSFWPFGYIDNQTEEPAGFDIDLIKAIGQEMGRDVEIVNTDWFGIFPGLSTGHYDLVISAITITDERTAIVDFSDPYFITGQVIVVKSDYTDITEPKDLANKRIGVYIDTTSHLVAMEVAGANVHTYPSVPATFLALQAGEIDTVITDELIAIMEVRSNPGYVKVIGSAFCNIKVSRVVT